MVANKIVLPLAFVSVSLLFRCGPAVTGNTQPPNRRAFQISPSPHIDVSTIQEGSYRAIFVATRGVQKGSEAIGRLWLHKAKADDRSPRTRERVNIQRSAFGELFYGAVVFDHQKVGATICLPRNTASVRRCQSPPPSSRDPIYPGLVLWHFKRAKKLVMTVGTHHNIRTKAPVELVLDEQGEFLFVHLADNKGICGTYSNGRFCAVREPSGTTSQPSLGRERER